MSIPAITHYWDIKHYSLPKFKHKLWIPDPHPSQPYMLCMHYCPLLLPKKLSVAYELN